MFNGVGRGAGVVDVDAGDAEARVIFAAVDHRRDPRRGRFDQRGRFLRQAMAEENQAVRLLALQHQGVALFAAFVVLRIAEEHRVAFPLRGIFDPLQDEREEGIGDVRHGHQQLAGAGGAQVFRRGIGRVAEGIDRFHHLEPGGFGDDARLAEHARDGGGRHTRALRDIVDGGHTGIFT